MNQKHDIWIKYHIIWWNLGRI